MPQAAPSTIDMHDAFLSDVNDAIDRMTLGAHDKAPARPAPRARLQRVVVAFDDSAGARHALAWGAWLARGAARTSELLIASAYSPPTLVGRVAAAGAWSNRVARETEEASEWARRVSGVAAATLTHDGYDAKPVPLEGSAARQIGKLARERRADLVIVGASSRSSSARERAFLGSTAMALLEAAPCSVLVARTDPPPVRVLAASDGSVSSYHALGYALSLASEARAELVVQHVLESSEHAEGSEETLRGIVEDIKLPRAPPKVRYALDVGNASAQILQRAGDDVGGLVVVGSHGRGTVERALLGRVSRRVAHDASASVLVVRA